MRNPKNYLICIGIDNYQHLESLNGNEEILFKISKLLIEKYGFEDNNIFSLFNEKATKQQLYLALKNPIRSVNDNVIVLYSGHGTEENQTNGYFQFFEAENNKPATWFSTNELTANINALRAKNVFVAIKIQLSLKLENFVFKNYGQHINLSYRNNITSPFFTKGRPLLQKPRTT